MPYVPGSPERFPASEYPDQSGNIIECYWLQYGPRDWRLEFTKTDRYGIRWSTEVSSRDSVTQDMAARALGVSMQTMTQWVRQGRIESRTHGPTGFVLIPVRDITRVARENGILEE
jgi:hypothetical protein